MKQLTFAKMHGAGNDFIVVDNRTGIFPSANRTWIRRICHRNHGIGAEGILLLESDPTLDFSMRFFNPDGGEAEMCGNGARCIALFAYQLGLASREMTFRTAAGPVHAGVQAEAVQIELPPPTGLRQGIRLPDIPLEVDCINTGVPHAVAFVEDLRTFPFETTAPSVRHHAHFAPAGVNFNAARQLDEKTLAVRTFERGVEAETPACGTGITASALLAALRFGIPSPIAVRCAHGDLLEVRFDLNGDASFSQVRLTGPAVTVFEGTIPLPEGDSPA